MGLVLFLNVATMKLSGASGISLFPNGINQVRIGMCVNAWKRTSAQVQTIVFDKPCDGGGLTPKVLSNIIGDEAARLSVSLAMDFSSGAIRAVISIAAYTQHNQPKYFRVRP